MPDRRSLTYSSAADVIADVERLRGGCDGCGQWTLAKACWHVNQGMSRSLKGLRTPNTPDQDAARPRLENVLATGQIPSGIKAPDTMEPPVDVPDSAIDDFLATLRQFDAHPGPFSTHRLFGNLTDDQMRRINLIHAAHHLSHFVPKGDR